jgi:N-acetyltransferase
MLRFIDPVTLTGREFVLLEPLEQHHADELLEAAKDGELYKLWYTGMGSAEAVLSYVDNALIMREEQGAMPFVARHKHSGQIIGTTRYFNVEPKHRRLEIGHTWFSKSVQRTGVNTEAKYMMLKHAFDKLNCVAVEFRTHFFNFQSRTAIERLGAKQDGVLRSHQIAPNGSLRDTVVFSILQHEWPTVKAHLLHQLQLHRDRQASQG